MSRTLNDRPNSATYSDKGNDPAIFVVVNGKKFPQPALETFFAGQDNSGCSCHPVAAVFCSCNKVCTCVPVKRSILVKEQQTRLRQQQVKRKEQQMKTRESTSKTTARKKQTTQRRPKCNHRSGGTRPVGCRCAPVH